MSPSPARLTLSALCSPGARSATAFASRMVPTPILAASGGTVYVAVKALGRHGVVLVEVEGHDVGEVETFLPVEPNQLPVDSDRRRAGRKPQNGPFSGIAPTPDQVGHAPGDPPGEVVVRGLHDNGDTFRV